MIAHSLAAAFDRIDDFLSVQGSRLNVDAVRCLQEAVGVMEAERAVIVDRLGDLRERGHTPEDASVLLGLFARQITDG